jgi:hypothetical protein
MKLHKTPAVVNRQRNPGAQGVFTKWKNKFKQLPVSHLTNAANPHDVRQKRQ